MSTRLEDSNTSQLIELTRHFRPRVAKRDLLVLVESDDDKPFWNIFFGKVKERYARITITTLKVRVEDSDEEKEEKGKDALMKVGGLGPSKVIAVDRDYDTLGPGYHQSMGWHEKTVCNEIAYCFEKTPHLAEDDDFNVIMAQIDAIDEPLGCVAQCPG